MEVTLIGNWKQIHFLVYWKHLFVLFFYLEVNFLSNPFNIYNPEMFPANTVVKMPLHNPLYLDCLCHGSEGEIAAPLWDYKSAS
jgi:hypothetical protein